MRFFKGNSGSEALQRSEWFAFSALSAALFSVGFSVSIAACSAKKVDPPGARPATSAAEVKAPASAQAVAATAGAPAVSPSVKLEAKPEAKPEPKPEPKKAAAASGRLGVKRFVIASAIEKREPVLVDKVPLASQPVFAFAELENPGADEQRVRFTFEREGAGEGVGHVELPVPGSSKRWRTWAQTRLIDAPGKWSAVLRDEQGNELARTPFEVL